MATKHLLVPLSMLAFVFASALSIMFGAAPAVAEDDDMPGIDHIQPSFTRALDLSVSLSDLEGAIGRMRDEPLYQRLSYEPYLIAGLNNSTRADVTGYDWQPGSHDLRLAAGRAAWILEGAFPIKIPTIDASTTDAERARAQEMARIQFAAYRAGVTQTIKTYRIGADIDALTKKYQAKIQEGTEENPGYGFWTAAGPHIKAMLIEFFPLGKKLSELETIFGRKAFAYDEALRERNSSEHVTGVFEYLYTGGMFGEAFFFLVKDGVIERVNHVPID